VCYVLTWTSPQPRWSSRSEHPAMPSWWMLVTPDDFQKVTVRRRRRVQRRYRLLSYRIAVFHCTRGFGLRDVHVLRPVHDGKDLFNYRLSIELTAIGVFIRQARLLSNYIFKYIDIFTAIKTRIFVYIKSNKKNVQFDIPTMYG